MLGLYFGCGNDANCILHGIINGKHPYQKKLDRLGYKNTDNNGDNDCNRFILKICCHVKSGDSTADDQADVSVTGGSESSSCSTYCLMCCCKVRL